MNSVDRSSYNYFCPVFQVDVDTARTWRQNQWRSASHDNNNNNNLTLPEFYFNRDWRDRSPRLTVEVSSQTV
jgi:hypothetical protein